MIRVTVLYNTPDDPDAFLEYYEKTHAPLAEKLPDLTRFTWGKTIGKDAPYFLTAELVWDTMEAMGASMASEHGKATADDVANFATGGVTMVVAEGH